ncbi:acyl-CoA dehydrogenase family protein [Streptomyces apocyni]|uniref:acyl-CoA dehydrogenase family protein n=1 Tax=Streptomyces apocyni TaxID=2654677 RepID=UPI0012EAA08E|nr:acyl-CoA dehydrogenase family protein [Streptomyces apocyni]
MSLTELFDDELIPVLRRLGDRPKGAGQEPPSAADADAREQVWAALAELGELRPLLPVRLGGPADALSRLVGTAELMGPALFQSPFQDTVLAAALLAADGRHDALLDRMAAGTRTIALAVRERGTDEPSYPLPLATDGGRLSGTRRFVAFAADVDLILVAGDREHALVPARAPGVTLRRHDEIGRGDLHRVILERAEPIRGGLLPHGSSYAAALARARVVQAGYLTGMARGALELAVERVRSRSAFGKPLAQHQALAHRLAAAAAEATVVNSFVRSVARDADAGHDIGPTAAQALFLAADLARDVTAEAVHLYGAAGLTEEQDISVFHRRAAVDTLRFGSPTALRREVAALLAARPHGLGDRRDE